MSHERKLTVLTRNQPRNCNQRIERSVTIHRTRYQSDKKKDFWNVEIKNIETCYAREGNGWKNSKKATIQAV